MDRSLDEIISERPARGGRRPEAPRRAAPPPRGPRREEYPRDGVRKYRRDEPASIDADWVHDRFEDDRYDRMHRRAPYETERPGPASERTSESGAKLRVDNVHYDLTEDDLRGLFESKGPTLSVKLLYDRMDRSQGTAFVTYESSRDARRAIADFDGCNANGQPIKLTLLPTAPAASATSRPGASLFDRIERPERSLFERMGDSRRDDSRGDNRRPARRDRSDSPRASGARGTTVPDHIDRYVPSRRASRSRSPIRRRGTPRGGEMGRRPGARREESGRGGERGGRRRGGMDDEGRAVVGGRPRKTAEELDAEMADYWGGKNGGEGGVKGTNGAGGAAAVVVDGSGGLDDDVDMVT